MRKIILIAMMLVTLASCESKSGRRVRIEDSLKTSKVTTTVVEEKVVILDSAPQLKSIEGNLMYSYKVQRLEKGVVDYVVDSELYESGDTILVKPVQFR